MESDARNEMIRKRPNHCTASSKSRPPRCGINTTQPGIGPPPETLVPKETTPSEKAIVGAKMPGVTSAHRGANVSELETKPTNVSQEHDPNPERGTNQPPNQESTPQPKKKIPSTRGRYVATPPKSILPENPAPADTDRARNSQFATFEKACYDGTKPHRNNIAQN